MFNYLQGWLPGLKGDGDSNQLPTIAIVASYDTFGAAPVFYHFTLSYNQVTWYKYLLLTFIISPGIICWKW